ncbi:hypothetical protein [Natronosalvus halobius]|uniref:hypothetical protein n=1 Tax=Natronosalvus halobius TaxID=2953746 RepID=UPI0020A20417|nr:hypothetical protein [Natronosalvus halobius]USZ70779.1 hypothetical protein NGM15_11790 [Natronosalvus halobius]
MPNAQIRDPALAGWDWRVLPAFVVVGALAFRSGRRLLAADPTPWALVVAAAIAGFVLLGPFAWLARGLLEARPRELAALVGFGAAVLTLPFGVTATMVLEVSISQMLEAMLVGAALGVVAVVLAERTTVPELVVETAAGTVSGG